MIRELIQWPGRLVGRLQQWWQHRPETTPAGGENDPGAGDSSPPADTQPDATTPDSTKDDTAAGDASADAGGWPAFTGPLESIPAGRAEMVAVYGMPDITYTKSGKIKADHHGRLSTVPAADIPGYARKIYMHRLVQPYFIEAMRRSTIACPDYNFGSIGCYNPRHQRYDPKRPLSDHTWGIAFDINPKQNRAFLRKRGDPLPFTPGWEQRSDLPRGVVEAWESVGFDWGGRWGSGERGGFCDPMHFSLRIQR
jgi:hypothetical protein